MVVQNRFFLAMQALGLRNDAPSDPLQPDLDDGVHLRWQSGAFRGFPWYGYYLFRRPAEPGKERCARGRFRGLSAQFVGPPFNGAVGTPEQVFPEGTFLSDRPLVVTDDFPPEFFAELDLRNRDWLSYRFSEPARHVKVDIGFREDSDGTRCIWFPGDMSTAGPNPLVVDGMSILVREADGSPAAITTLPPAGAIRLLDLRAGATLTPPCPSDRVILGLLSGNTAGEVRALDANGDVIATSGIPDPTDGLSIVDLQADGIVSVDISLPQNETQLVIACWHCEAGGIGANPDSIDVEFLAGDVVVHSITVSGAPGSIVTTEFSSDLLTEVRLTGGDAALVDICYTPVRIDFQAGWELMPDLSQPIALPVRDFQYPASGNQAANQAASEAEAIGRISYGNPATWQGARFDELYGALEDLVDQGPAGPLMFNAGGTQVPGVPDMPTAQEQPDLERYRTVQLLALGALYPPVAQMLGQYWIDRTAQVGQRYDYLVVADLNGVSNGTAESMLAWLTSGFFDENAVDAWISFDVGLEVQQPLATPLDLQAFALPGGSFEASDGSPLQRENNVGLDWSVPELQAGSLEENAPVLYWVRRAELGRDAPPDPAPPDDHSRITQLPQVVTQAILPPGETPERSTLWPPQPMKQIDVGLDEGWYSYRVTGVDIFGRWTPPSAPAEWRQWTPAPAPLPWYFDANQGDAQVHPHAVSLLDKMPPPPPAGVEAFALDLEDPYLLRDARHDTWVASLSAQEQAETIGLRVRWLWTQDQMAQAPDTEEFRIYRRDGQANTFKGRTSAVTVQDADHARVETTIANAAVANAWSGAALRVDGRSFTVTASEAGDPLVLIVARAGVAKESPTAESGCSLSLPGGANATHALSQDMGDAQSWEERIWTVGIDDHIAEGVVPTQTASGDELAGENATEAGGVVTLPAGADISGIFAFDYSLFLAEDIARPSRIYRITSVDPAARTLVVDGNPTLAGGQSGWEVGKLVRRYDVFLPAPGDADRAGQALTPSRADPVVYAQIGVSAVDDKTHTGDAAKWDGTRFGDRTGNESRVGGPATINRVHRVPPDAPQVPEDSDAVFASRPDFQRRSFYTVRWVPDADLRAHVFRAMDQSIFARDLVIRETRGGLDGVEHEAFFPDGWDENRRANAANELNTITGPGDYDGLSADAVEVLGRVPGNEGFAATGGLNARDWDVRRTRTSLGQADAAYFPPDWADPLKRQAAADILNAITGPADYAALSNDALRVLAALPGVETVFQQMTDRALSNADADTGNFAGPDNTPGFVVDAALRAYVDGIDGRSRNRYFYRTAFIDDAQNIGPMGLSSPPVNLHDVAPPRRPTWLRAIAGQPDQGQPQDRHITLVWGSNREPDLLRYRLYRTADADAARKTRLMDELTVVDVAPGDPMTRPEEIVFVDTDVPGLIDFTYRLEAEDSAGNRSLPSEPIVARAFDVALPEIPALAMEWADQAGEVRASASWVSVDEVTLQRRQAGFPWTDVALWRPAGNETFRDEETDPTADYSYRLRVRKYTGAVALGPVVDLAGQGG